MTVKKPPEITTHQTHDGQKLHSVTLRLASFKHTATFETLCFHLSSILTRQTNSVIRLRFFSVLIWSLFTTQVSASSPIRWFGLFLRGLIIWHLCPQLDDLPGNVDPLRIKSDSCCLSNSNLADSRCSSSGVNCNNISFFPSHCPFIWVLLVFGVSMGFRECDEGPCLEASGNCFLLLTSSRIISTWASGSSHPTQGEKAKFTNTGWKHESKEKSQEACELKVCLSGEKI